MEAFLLPSMSPFRTRSGGLAHARARATKVPNPFPSSWFTPMLPLVFVFVRLEKKESDTLKLRWCTPQGIPFRAWDLDGQLTLSKFSTLYLIG
ncbi:hypothetical protein F2Q70_00033231 [Brassica cretica]|uniref:Uncharacterized protein n=2 Tax=Brassica cretica TaxID=69181 RepID=A0A3N6TFG6_BRACR|nr:hypothetical protein F2Q70_00033231 [Brassica cretica]KAF2554334.1 hypothetical protein F2Q68_00037543 [Brassica cretica]KAF3597333.1 hypothetical protein DY000_02027494 [Brassica cretica]